MASSVRVFLSRLARRVWFRAALVSLAAVVFALATGLIETLLPWTPSVNLGQGAVDDLLHILASSMLAVTTFSLTAMVTAYSSATTTATPRATQLLVQDTTSQSVLSTFVGAFVFSLVGIIALSTGYYSDRGRTVLFLGTLVVIALIVVTLLRWIAHLAEFGRMSDVIDRVEKAATDAAAAFARRPTLGGAVLRGPSDGTAVHAASVGYVTHVDVAALQRIAEKHEITLDLESLPGRVADATTPLLRSSRPLGEDIEAAVRAAFTVDPHRTYEQDPRLGIIALAEIASRALSPSTNDPGTAIQVIGAVQRVLTTVLSREPDPEVEFDRVRVRPIAFEDLLEDAVRPLARDGRSMVEVQIRLQKCLSALAAVTPDHRELLRRSADDAWARAKRELVPEDAAALRAARRAAWGRRDRG
ncbi:DUF2254 domain-containing protein [Microbacterium sp. LjRoot45]|uniref:DUF2254 domain-containing protein n=1 Tax=Microbacterium sp. LjRoot45 TaxID=3342329 RepID=UPI003ECC376E